MSDLCVSLLAGVLHGLYGGDGGFVREVSTLIKIVDFATIPLLQILTSPPIRRFTKSLMVELRN